MHIIEIKQEHRLAKIHQPIKCTTLIELLSRHHCSIFINSDIDLDPSEPIYNPNLAIYCTMEFGPVFSPS